mgnify:CR=1 FL=1
MFLVFVMHIDLDECIQDPQLFKIESIKEMITRASNPWLPEYIYFERNHSVIWHVAFAWRQDRKTNFHSISVIFI